jgi:2-methylcitrate dehydratase PrpD
MTHPTMPVLAASLAVGQEVSASGQAFLAAFCAGIEVECRLADAIHPKHYQQGFHSTGTIGCFGAVAAAGKLLGLSYEQTRYAIGIAASKAAGVRANFGTMTKPYHAGGAQAGVEAAKLASLGFTADRDALDGPWGFFQVTAGGVDAERIRDRLGNPYYFIEPGISIKPYPCGSLIHPAMDGLLDLVLEQDIKPEDVDEIRFGTSSNVLTALRYDEPQNALEAKFSIPFCLAILVVERAAGIGQFQDEVVQMPDIRQLVKRVKKYLDDEIEAKGYDLIRSRIDVRLRDGRSFTIYPELSRGTPQRPMSRSELEAKFHDCASQSLPDANYKSIMTGVFGIDDLDDINNLVRLMVL